ncbi:uncharacterized protein V6R79_015493 [Siganus canaliculatus]
MGILPCDHPQQGDRSVIICCSEQMLVKKSFLKQPLLDPVSIFLPSLQQISLSAGLESGVSFPCMYAQVCVHLKQELHSLSPHPPPPFFTSNDRLCAAVWEGNRSPSWLKDVPHEDDLQSLSVIRANESVDLLLTPEENPGYNGNNGDLFIPCEVNFLVQILIETTLSYHRSQQHFLFCTMYP